MKRALGLALAISPALALASTWDIDASHTSATFAVRHMMISTVRGTFGSVTGKIDLDEKDLSKSVVEASIDTSTVDTRDAKRDGHLKSGDFFDVQKYPAMSFKSTRVEKAAGNKLRVTGELTIRDVTRPVVLEVEPTGEAKDPQGGTRRAYAATTTLHRKDFGLKWNMALEGGGVLVGDEVQISLDLETRKVEAKKS